MEINSICVCGAGTMGNGIAQAAAQAGIATLLYELNPEVLEKAKDATDKNLQMLVEKEKITADDKEKIIRRIHYTTDIQSCFADVFIEAIVEKAEIKIALFNQLAEINHSECIFATNTSSLSVTAIAKKIQMPERVIGMHFFNPATIMKLVEVVTTSFTSENTTTAIIDLAKQMGKVPVLCKDAPGFIVNRVARSFYTETMRLVEEGQVTVEVADKLLEASGFKMGPFKLMDLIGNDVNYAVSTSVYQQMNNNERFKPSFIQEQKVKEGKLGRKSGEGFYKYTPNPRPTGSSGRTGVGGKILVTGGTGFLGSYIIKQLIEKGYNVRAIRRSSKLPFWIATDLLDKVEWVEGDVLDIVALEDAMEGVDTVIHSAAVVSFAKKDRKQMYQVNVDGTANMVNVALEKNVRRFIHISSVAALGRTADGGNVNEQKKWEESKVNTHYAISKFKAELQAWRGLNEGLEGVILNPSTILGYGDWNNSSCAIFKKIDDGFNWYTSGINGFIDVEDAARATILMMESNITEERYIVNGDSWSFKKLQDTIADGLNKKRPLKQATPLLMGIAWRIEKIKSLFTGKKPLLSKESARVAQSQTRFENDKLLKALPGFSFTPLEESIKKASTKYLAQEETKHN